MRVVLTWEGEADEGELRALHEDIWEYVISSWRRWGVLAERRLSLYLQELGEDEEPLTFAFPSPAGSCDFEREVAQHWFLRVLDCSWSSFQDRFFESDLELLSQAPERDDNRLVTLRGEAWVFQVGGHYLRTDRQGIRRDELSEEEQERVTRAEQVCECRACSYLRPDDEIAEQILQQLQAGELDEVAWHLTRLLAPKAALMEAVAPYQELWPAIERLGARGLACEGMPLLVRLLLGKGREERVLTDVVEGLSSPVPVCTVAAELASGLRPDRHVLAPLLMETLQERAGEDADTRHAVVLALINLCLLAGGPLPEGLVAMLEREAARPEQGAFTGATMARWALQGLLRPP